VSIAPGSAGDKAHNYHFILSRYSGEGLAQPFQVCEDKEDRVPQTEQPGHTATASEEQDDLLSLEGRSGPFEDHMQVDKTMKAAKHSSEIPHIPAHLDLVPAVNAVVHMEGGEVELEGRRDVAMSQIQQAKHQESREITQTYLENQEGGAGAKEEGDLMEESPQAISDAESVTTSQLTSPKRHKKRKVERRGLRPGIEVGVW
jgi:hypothetical protein